MFAQCRSCQLLCSALVKGEVVPRGLCGFHGVYVGPASKACAEYRRKVSPVAVLPDRLFA